MATALPNKKGMGTFSADKVKEFIEELRDTNNGIIMKSDQEETINLLLDDLVQSRAEGKTFINFSFYKNQGFPIKFLLLPLFPFIVPITSIEAITECTGPAFVYWIF